MTYLQKMIEKAKVEQVKAFNEFSYHRYFERYDVSVLYEKIYDALTDHIQKLTLLSDKHTGAITVAAHSANTVLGDVCLCCGRRLSGSSGAATSETGDVGQNLGDGSCEAT